MTTKRGGKIPRLVAKVSTRSIQQHNQQVSYWLEHPSCITLSKNTHAEPRKKKEKNVNLDLFFYSDEQDLKIVHVSRIINSQKQQ